MRYVVHRITVSGLVVLLLSAPWGVLADITPDHNIKWSQLPNMTEGVDWSSDSNLGTEVADDFECWKTGYIDDVHWWGSLLGDQVQPDYFTMTLYQYVPPDPADPESFSKPGAPIKSIILTSGVYQLNYFGTTTESDEEVWQYYVDMGEWGDERLFQEQGEYYFISIVAGYDDPQGYLNWGWHESSEQWNDDATNRIFTEPWNPITAIRNDELVSIDMAFELSEIPEPGTLALFGLGLLAAGAKLRRRKLR